MGQDLSPRLAACINALPLRQACAYWRSDAGQGCSPRGLAALGDGFVLAIDRSSKGHSASNSGVRDGVGTKRLEFLQVLIEDFELAGEERCSTGAIPKLAN